MYHGVLAIWKPAGMTSHDVVFKLRKILQMKKIGHTGTLDPDVEGVLLICLGQATKLVEFLMDGSKEYSGEITVGFSTETEDAHGEIVEQKSVDYAISEALIDLKMSEFIGRIQQIPPYYSAVKVNGKRLYEYARQGIQVKRPVRMADVYEFKRLDKPRWDSIQKIQSWSFNVKCGKGTYVRTLAVDLGKELGYPSHMSQLTRLSTGGFTKEQAITLEELQELKNQNQVEKKIYTIEEALQEYPSLQLNERQFKDVQHGKVLPKDYFNYEIDESTTLWYENKIVAIYYPHPSKDGLIKPQRMFI